MNPYSLDAFLDYLDHRRTPHMAIAPTIDCTLNGNPSVIIPADMFERLNREHAGNADLRAALEQERQKRASLTDRHAEHLDRLNAEHRAEVAELSRERDQAARDRDAAIRDREGSYWSGRSWADNTIAEAHAKVEQAQRDVEDVRANAAKHAEEAAELRRKFGRARDTAGKYRARVQELEDTLARPFVAAAVQITEHPAAEHLTADAVTEALFEDVGLLQQRMVRDHATAQRIAALTAERDDARSLGAAHSRTIDALIAQQDADAELIDRLAKERDEARAVRQCLGDQTAHITIERDNPRSIGGDLTVEYGGETIKATTTSARLEPGPRLAAAVNVTVNRRNEPGDRF